jgi:hypothetical protein
MYYRLFAAWLAIAVLLSGCTATDRLIGSGKKVTLEKDVAGFTRVEIGSAFTAEITAGDRFSTVITIDQNFEKALRVVQEGDTLRIYLDWRSGYSLRSGDALQVKITMPELTGLALSGASTGTVKGFRSGKDLSMNVSGASKLNGELQARDVKLTLSGASSTVLSGSGRNGDLNVSGASKADLEKLTLADVKVEVSGASQATVHSAGRLDVRASGASKLFYVGQPTLGSVDSSGASTIQRR